MHGTDVCGADDPLRGLPPRQHDDTIPRELDRICLKVLSKRASERYSTARDMAEDLRHFLNEAPSLDTARSTLR